MDSNNKPQLLNNSNALVDSYLKIISKSFLSLQSISRDINVAKINMGKLVKLEGGKPITKPDAMWKSPQRIQKEFEKKVESSKISKIEEIKKPDEKPDGKPEEKPEEKKKGILDSILGIFNFKNLFSGGLLKILGKLSIPLLIVSSLWEGISSAWEAWTETGSIWEAYKSVIGGIVDFLSFGLIDKKLVGELMDDAANFLKPFLNAVSGFIEKIGKWFSDKFSFVSELFGPKEKLVPKDNIKGLHDLEEDLNKRKAELKDAEERAAKLAEEAKNDASKKAESEKANSDAQKKAWLERQKNAELNREKRQERRTRIQTAAKRSAPTPSSTPETSATSGTSPSQQSSSDSSGGSRSSGGSGMEKLLAFISKGEGGYNAMNQGTRGGQIVGSTQNSSTILGKKLTDMTIGEIVQNQKEGKLFAAGRYQIIPITMPVALKGAGAGMNDKFDEKTQDELGKALIFNRPTLGGYIKKRNDNLRGAMKDFAMEWASMPDPDTGNSYYGSGNRASHSVEEVKSALQEARGDKGDTTPTNVASAASTVTPSAAGASSYGPSTPSSGGDSTAELSTLVTKSDSGVDISGFKPAFAQQLAKAASEFKQVTGKKIQINSGYRSNEKQKQLYDDWKAGRLKVPAVAEPAPPLGNGRGSLHSSGMAADIQPTRELEQNISIFTKNGLIRNVPGEAWHFQLGNTPPTPDNPQNPGAPIVVADSNAGKATDISSGKSVNTTSNPSASSGSEISKKSANLSSSYNQQQRRLPPCMINAPTTNNTVIKNTKNTPKNKTKIDMGYELGMAS